MAAALLGTVLAANALAVDTGAEAAFEAPKRLVTTFGIAAAAAAAFAFAPRRDFLAAAWRRSGRSGRAVLALVAAALAAGFASAVLSPRRALSLDACRTVALFGLLLALGASRAVAQRGRTLFAVFLAGCAVNAGVSILEGRGIFRPFEIEATGAGSAGAFLGNVGYLALACALAAVGAAAALRIARRPAARCAVGLALLLCVAAIAVNQNRTAVTALAAGAVALGGSFFGRRALLLSILVVAVGAGVVMALPTFRARAGESVRALRAGDWDRLLSYRLGAWAAAEEMVRERPLTGFGPGTFGAEFVPHRLAAEIRHRRRFVNPLLTSSYGEAHSDFLQPIAEAGLAGAAAVAAGLLLLASLGRAARRGPARLEAALLFAVLVAGAVAALTWFPFQRTVTAVPLLLAAGRGWRVGLPADEGTAP